MTFSNLTLSGFKYSVDNPDLLTILNNHVVTDVLEKAILKAGTNLSPKCSALTFNTSDGQSPKILRVQMSYTIVITLQNITHSAVTFPVHFRVLEMFRICNHAHG